MTGDEIEAKAEAVAPTLNFIRDNAAEVDFFGSHARVAQAVAEVVSRNDDLKVIGLLGPWGSGKSTVVRHVQKRLNALDADTGGSTHVFCYDAWLHQSDPPRRAFLETLVAFLDGAGLSSATKWKPDLDRLNGQVEESVSTSTPSFTAMGYVFLLSLLLVPLGLHFIGHDWYEAAGESGARFPIKYVYLGGWLLLGIPLVVALLTYMFGGQGRHAVLALFVNRQVQTQVNRVTRSPDPTTIEFQGIFRRIIADVAPQKRLIFVIDNLDRLHEAEAVAMWNTIRSFFLGSEHADRLSRDRKLPTVLLPIDREAVERIYSREHGEHLGRRLARAFMDKTFDLAFQVPPPVLSDWNDYLQTQLQHVFGTAFEPQWGYQVGRLYEARSRGDEITPRAINVTLNAIATLWLQWRTDLPFVTIAYYSIFRDQIDADVYKAVGAPIVHIADIDPDWQRGVAALHFGAPPQKAIQVLIEPRLRNAFTQWDVDAFRKLADYPGFAEVLQKILDDPQPVRMTFIAQACHLLSEQAPEKAPWVEAAWAALREMFVRGQPYDALDDWDGDALATLMKSCPSSSRGEFARRAALRLEENLEGVFGNDDDARTVYMRLVEMVATTARDAGVNDVLVRFPGGVDSYLAALAHVAVKPSVAGVLVTALPDQQVATALAAQLKGTEAGQVGRRFRAVLHQKRNANWDGLIEAARRHLAEQPSTSAGTRAAGEVLGRLWSSSDKAKTALRGLKDEGLLLQRLKEAAVPPGVANLPIVTALSILVSGSLETGVAWDGLLKSDPALPTKVRTALDLYDPGGVLGRLVKVSQESPNALAVCRAIVTAKVREGSLGTLNLDNVLTHFQAYLACIEPLYRTRFIALLSGYTTVWETLEKRPFDETTQRVLSDLATTTHVSSDVAKAARSQLRSRLRAASASDWTKAIETGVQPLTAARHLARVSRGSINVGGALLEALNLLVPRLVVPTTPDWAVRWFAAVDHLSVPSRKAVHRNLGDRLTAEPAPDLPAVLTFASEQFLAESGIDANPDRAVRNIATPLLASDMGIQWMSVNADLVGGWLIAAPSEARDFFKEQCKARSRALDTTAQRKQLRALVSQWKL